MKRKSKTERYLANIIIKQPEQEQIKLLARCLPIEGSGTCELSLFRRHFLLQNRNLHNVSFELFDAW
jgi:hypothetical protein